jgi:hypothetical protein
MMEKCDKLIVPTLKAYFVSSNPLPLQKLNL